VSTKSTIRIEEGEHVLAPDSTFTVLLGNAIAVLTALPSESIHCCVTSPPYYRLRDYGTAKWEGGNDPLCDHLSNIGVRNDLDRPILGLAPGSHDELKRSPFVGRCGKCGATSTDDQIGLEETPEEYIDRLVLVFREVRRVLRADGTLWINIGDSYAGSGKGRNADGSHRNGGKQTTNRGSIAGSVLKTPGGLVIKPKNLIGTPWMLAFALRKDGWYLRSEIIWHKRSSMVESVKDRPTRAHEQIFLLSKSPKYFYDADAIKEPSKYPNDDRKARVQPDHKRLPTESVAGMRAGSQTYPFRNKRDVWSMNPKGCKDAHFAVFPPELPENCILAGSPKGGLVLDPFNGAGTTGIIAAKHGRSYIGIELNPEYIEITKRTVKRELDIEVSTTFERKVKMTTHSRDEDPTRDVGGVRFPRRDGIGVADEIDRNEDGRRIIKCLKCGTEDAPEAAFGLCYKCYRREKRSQQPKRHMHAPGQQKEQIRLTKLYSQMMTAAIALGMDEGDIRHLQILLQPYLELVPRLLNTTDIGFLFEKDSDDQEPVNSSRAAA
jgi:DNA modification methylase